MKVTNQHGDVIFQKVDSIPQGLKKQKAKKNFIIEKGEGVHTHTFIDGDCEIFISDSGEIYLQAKTPITIDHEEHKQMVIEPGIYKKVIEREFDYETMESRRTID